MKKVTVITVNYNGLRHLKYSIPSLIRQSYPNKEIILIDNASHDGSVEFMRKKFPDVKIICNKKNNGPPAMNLGITRAGGDYILLCGNDTRYNADFIESMVEAMESDRKIGMVQPKIMLKATQEINTLGLALFPSGRTQDIIDENRIDMIFCPCGCAELIRKEALESIRIGKEYFDSDFFWGCEDYDLGFRMVLQGWRCVYESKAVMEHVHGGTMPSSNDLAIYYGDRNRIWTILKNFPTGLLIRYFISIIVLQILTILKYTLKGKMLLIMRAKWDALRNFKKMFKKRKIIQKNRVISNKVLRKKISGGWI